MFLLAALSLGFLGSFHCIGMCGPIAMSIPVKRTSMFSLVFGAVIYNGGRVFTYTCLGFLFGLLGKGFMMAGLQSALSIGLGIGVLSILFLPKISFLPVSKGALINVLEKVKSNIRSLFGKNTRRALLLIGVLNGLLPCGLVYLGIAGAVAVGSALNGALFMLGFGLGTLPAMLLITVIKDVIGLQARAKIRKVMPLFIAAMGVLLILRGMNLGIPYVSPRIEITSDGSVHSCCHKK